MRKAKFFLVSALTLAMAGCMTVGPDYQAPEQLEAQLQTFNQQQFDFQRMEENWWGQFNDPRIEKLVDLALADNHDIAKARANVKAAYAAFDDSRDDRFPKGGAGAEYSASRAKSAPTFSDAAKVEQYSAGGNLSWNLDFFGRVTRLIEAAEAEALSSDAALRNVQVEIIAEVVRVYADLRGAQAQIQVAQRNLENLKSVVDLTEAKYKTGVGAELDVVRSKAQYAGAQATLAPLQARIARDEYRLAVLTGVEPGKLAVDLNYQPIPQVATTLAIGDPAELLRRRPDVRVAERRLASASARIGVATADLFPKVEMTGFLGFISGSGSELLKSSSGAWSVAPTLNWAVFDWASLKARVRVAEAHNEAALEDYQQTVLRALEDAQLSFVNYHQSQQRYLHLQAQVESSARAQEIAQAQYKEGFIDLLVLLDTERTRLAAEDAAMQAETDIMKGVVEIYRSLGGGWEAPADNVAATGSEAFTRG
ncbi:efflux transporter outer membrane subunit [Hahella sp. KA22]|uniref:efflux transporter outer membrane subunit n=1 Tax=Hahella sp. KA22 TaxID=1628392 RepID=UPI000FDD4EF3|nr:TolC family protein [Hahella sp. KA22]AZZ95246.1 TolC family protein [Hahella sp. KA22]QAY52891.1 efflux transporter outer membrane subunit [Hahella sp. KA22]